MIRPTRPDDTPALVALTERTGVFKPHELVALREVLDDYHAVHHREGHRASTLERSVPPGKVIHAILDNYAAHKHPEVLAWLAAHPR